MCQLLLNSGAQGVHTNSFMTSVLWETGISNISQERRWDGHRKVPAGGEFPFILFLGQGRWHMHWGAEVPGDRVSKAKCCCSKPFWNLALAGTFSATWSLLSTLRGKSTAVCGVTALGTTGNVLSSHGLSLTSAFVWKLCSCCSSGWVKPRLWCHGSNLQNVQCVLEANVDKSHVLIIQGMLIMWGLGCLEFFISGILT